LGGRIWVLENNQNGSPVWVEKKPSSIQFPSLFLSYSKQLFKNCDVEVAFTGYNKKWRRPELNNNGLNTMFSSSVNSVTDSESWLSSPPPLVQSTVGRAFEVKKNGSDSYRNY